MNKQGTISYKEKLEKLETTILELKKVWGLNMSQNVISLKGLLKGTNNRNQDIEKSKKSLFGGIKNV